MCSSLLSAHQVRCLDCATCAEEALQAFWSCFMGTACVGGEVAPGQGATLSLLMVMVSKGTTAGKSPFAIKLSDSLHISLGFILRGLFIEKLHLMVQ